MRKWLYLITGFFFSVLVSGQTERKFSLYGNLYGDLTIYDRTIIINPCGAGTGIDWYLNINPVIRPKVELDISFFVTPDIVFESYPGEEKHFLPCFFAGPSANIGKRVEMSFTAGPGLIQSKIFAGFRPTFSFYTRENKYFKTEISLTHIFQRDQEGKIPFGFISLGIGFNLFKK
jgi:hypothetical protein